MKNYTDEELEKLSELALYEANDEFDWDTHVGSLSVEQFADFARTPDGAEAIVSNWVESHYERCFGETPPEWLADAILSRIGQCACDEMYNRGVDLK